MKKQISLLSFIVFFLSFGFLSAQTTVTYTSSGTWTCPAGVTSATVQCWGGGGGGGSRTSNGRAGGGGGGAYSTSVVTVVPGNNYTITIGAGGAAGVNGGSSSFASSVIAVGGTGVAANSTTGGSGGLASACTGTTKYDGGTGGGTSTSAGGGGGGGAGSTGAGGTGGIPTGGTGTSLNGGDGGAGASTTANGSNGNNYGGGGGGARGNGYIGGTGAQGLVTITYTIPCPTISLSGTSAVTPVSAGSTSTVTVTGTAAALPVGTYTVTYNLSGANTATGSTATMTVSTAGTGTFTTSTLANAGTTTITITSIKYGSCTTTTISSNNTASIVTTAAYCTPSGSSSSYYINSFSTTGGTTNITNNSSGYSTGGYGNFLSMTVTQIQGSTVNFSITGGGSSYTYGFSIWVDWNQDADFADAGEQVFVTSGYATSTSGSFTVPLSALSGSTRMRVTANYLSTAPSNPCATSIDGEFEDYTFSVTALPACSGTVTGGTAAASPTSLCAGNTSTLSVTGGTTGVSGLTYQWQSSTDNVTWTDITGATSATYTATPTANTYYRRIITCTASASSANSTSVLVSINAPSSCYCTPASTYTTYYVSNFATTGGSTNISNNTGACSAGGYGNFTAQTVTQEQGMTVSFSATIVGSSGFSIWVDWNQDGDFTDSDEAVYAPGTYGTTFSGSFTVPVTALTGSTRMRIRSDYNDSSPDPCSSISYGEAEDYTFTVTVSQNMTYTSSAVTQTVFTSVTPGETNREIIGIQVVTNHAGSPLVANSFTFATTGTTTPATDIQNARLWYTGTSSTFATTTQVGGAESSPNGNFTITPSQTLEAGTNYFWLTYDITAGATINNYVDAVCSNINISSSNYAPIPSTVAGTRQILNVTTIGTGTSTAGYPFYAYYGYTRSASLLTAAEIGVAGNITHLAWNVATAQTTNIPVKIYLKTTNDAVLTSQTWANLISGATLVYDATVQFTPTGWKTLDITDFNYCTGNLLVLCEANYGSSGTSTYPYFYYTTQSTYKHETLSADASAPTGSGTLSYNRPNIQVTKTSPTQCSGTPTAGTISATPSSVTNCSTPIVLSASGYSTTCGLEYQWQWSNDNATWTDIPYGTTIPLSTTPLGNLTYYRLKVSCIYGGSPAYSSSVSVTGTASGSSLSYTFSATSGSYSSISGTQAVASAIDEGYTNNIPIGFNFQYGCQSYTQVAVSSNGWLSFNSVSSASLSNDLASNSIGNVVAPLWDDLATYTAGQVRYTTTGSSPNRIFTVEWYNMEWNYSASANVVSFEVKLHETTNVIEFIYHDAGGTATSGSASIGLSGATSGEYYSLSSSGSNPTVSQTSETTSISTKPTEGQTYIWTPSTCSSAPTGGTITANPASGACQNSNVTLSATGYTGGCDITYTWQYSLDGLTWEDMLGCNFAIPTTVTPTVSPTYYRLEATCTSSGLTGYSNELMLEILSAPVNDLPCNAIPISMGGIEYGDNSCSSALTESGAASCWDTGTLNTVWYSFVAPASGSVKIKTQPGSLTQTQIAVYGGNCSSLTQVGCNDDMSTNCETTYYISELSLTGLTAGITYFIRVDGDNDLMGTFTISVIDGANNWPLAYGQDCGMQILVCSENFTVGNPGYQAIGNYCDFEETNICLLSGDRGSVWYYVPITTTGTFNFVLTPNDFNPAGSLSNETDYDFAIWRIGGHAPLATCATILAGDTAGGIGPLSCNYNSLGVTGCSPTGNYTVGTLVYDAAFETSVAVQAGDTLLINISNFTNSTSGFNINFTTSTTTIGYPPAGSVTSLTWTGGAGDTDWFKPLNWGDCNNLIPSPTIDAIIPPASSNMPIINAVGAQCKSLSVNASALCGINAGYTLEVYGDITNYGTLSFNDNSTVIMSGAANQQLEGNFIGTSAFGNFTVNKTNASVVRFNQDVQADGNFTTSNANSAIDANGKLVKVGGNVSLFNSTFTTGTDGEFRLINGNAQTINTGNNSMYHFTMQKTSNSATLLADLTVTHVLTLNSGIINTGAYKVICTSTIAADITGHNILSYINGNLRKYFANNTSTYDFPMGTSTAYRLAELKNNSLSGITYMDVKFVTPFTNTGTLNTAICQDFGTPYDNICPEGVWQIDPNAAPGSGSYDIYLWFDGGGANAFAGLIDNGFAPVKRPSASTLASDWSAAPGTINPAGGLGRLVSHGYALRKTVTAFSQHAIARTNSALPVTMLSFAATCSDQGADLEWIVASETNANYYLIEKSTDNSSFVEVARVYATGNSNNTLHYAYSDASENKNCLYRLSEFDIDGTGSIVGFAASDCADYDNSIFNAWYNEITEEVSVKFDLQKADKYHLQLFDASGKLIGSKVFDLSENGIIQLSMPAPGLASGVYTIVLFGSDSYSSGKTEIHR